MVEAAPPPTISTTPPPPPATSGCTLAAQNPADGTVYGVSASFATTWLLQNTGSTPWTQGEYDFVFAGAVNNVKLHMGPDVYDLASHG